MSRPATGVRYAVVREGEPVQGEEVVYRGFAHRPDADVPLEVRIERPSGATRAEVTAAGEARPPDAADLEKTAAALVRTATKAAIAAGEALPRKIVRWRGSPGARG